MMHEEKPGWKKRALDELRKLSITVLYIWVLLGVFTRHREIILANYHINYSAKFGFAFINLVKVWHGQSFAASFSETVADPRSVFASMLLMFVVLIPFFFAKGLIEILGKDEIKRLLLKARTEG